MITKTSNGRYRVRVFHRGVEVCGVTLDRRRDAESWERAQKLQLVAGTWTPPALSKVTLAEAIAEFAEARRGAVAEHTFDTDEANLRLHLPSTLKRRAMSSITKQQLDQVFASLLGTMARTTVGRIRNSVSSLFAWAVEQQYLGHNVVLDTKLPRGTSREIAQQIRPFTSRELAAVIASIAQAHPVYADLVEFAALTGLRWGELAALRVDSFAEVPYPVVLVDRSRSDGYSLKTTKSGKSRRVPLQPRAVEILERLTEGLGHDELVFRAPRGGEIRATAFTRAVGWDTLTPHTFHELRHTFATNAIQANVDVQTVSHWLGHSDAATTMRIYSHWLGADSDLNGLARLAQQHQQVAGIVTPIERTHRA